MTKDLIYLRDLYNNKYRNFLSTSPFPFKKISFTEDLTEKPYGQKSIWGNKADPFLTVITKDIEVLAMDIEENGTYFPIIIRDENLLVEGLHRIESMKLAYDKGLISDKKFLAIDISIITDHLRCKTPLPEYMHVEIPHYMCNHKELLKFYLELGLDLEKVTNNQLGYSVVRIDTYETWYRVHQLFSTSLRGLLFKYRIPPLEGVNPC